MPSGSKDGDDETNLAVERKDGGEVASNIGELFSSRGNVLIVQND
jgi:hypothetical protein